MLVQPVFLYSISHNARKMSQTPACRRAPLLQTSVGRRTEWRPPRRDDVLLHDPAEEPRPHDDHQRRSFSPGPLGPQIYDSSGRPEGGGRGRPGDPQDHQPPGTEEVRHGGDRARPAGPDRGADRRLFPDLRHLCLSRARHLPDGHRRRVGGRSASQGARCRGPEDRRHLGSARDGQHPHQRAGDDARLAGRRANYQPSGVRTSLST